MAWIWTVGIGSGGQGEVKEGKAKEGSSVKVDHKSMIKEERLFWQGGWHHADVKPA